MSDVANKIDGDSSDSLKDEEELLRNSVQEAKKILESGTLPKNSFDRYLLVYNTYKKWRQEHENSLCDSYESNLIVNFNDLKKN